LLRIEELRELVSSHADEADPAGRAIGSYWPSPPRVSYLGWSRSDLPWSA